MTETMTTLLDEFVQRASRQEVYTGNIAGGMLGILMSQKEGLTIEVCKRNSGNSDLRLVDRNGKEVIPFWNTFFRTFATAIHVAGEDNARLITEDLAYEVMRKCVTEYGLNPDEIALVMSTDKALLYADFNDLNGKPEDYTDNMLQIANQMDDCVDIGLYSRLVAVLI